MDKLIKTITREMEEMVGVTFDGEVVMKPNMLYRRMYGEFTPIDGNISIAEELFEMSEVAFINVLKHELIHAMMWSCGYRAHDGTSKFEHILKSYGLITNGNYPLTEKVVLGHKKGRVVHCFHCNKALFDDIKLDDDLPRVLCGCKKSSLTSVAYKYGEIHDIIYHTYQYKILDSVRNEFKLNGELKTIGRYYFELLSE